METSERFGGIIIDIIRMIVDGACEFLEIPLIDRSVVAYDEGQKFMFRNTLRAPVGKFLKNTMGAKSPEHADEIVSGLGGLVAFGYMGFKIVLHFWKEAPKSPKIQRWKAKVASGGGLFGRGRGAPRGEDRPRDKAEAERRAKEVQEGQFRDAPAEAPKAPTVPAGAALG